MSDLKADKQKLSTLLNDNKSPEAIKLLRKLFQVEISKETLRQTRIGVFVNDLRKHKNASSELKETCKDLISKWKNDVKDESGSTLSERVEARTNLTDGIKFELRDKVRSKCAELLYNAFLLTPNSHTDPPSSSVKKQSLEIEEFVYRNHGEVNGEYKARMRSLVSNLKTNPQLRSNVLDGVVSCERFSRMTTEEMMSSSRKEEVEKVQKANMADAIGAQVLHSETDMFKCGKCGKRRTTYFQMQTRSADEPMTTFVTCLHCDNRWKFC